jgi:phosphodiesterase/alkaline phosphatase D-like protein
MKESGLYTAWRRIAEENLDFVFHYGDYIYEFARSQTAFGGRPAVWVMPEDFFTCINLLDYRRRYALYKTNPDLQAAHASCAFLPSFDDHEVSNNWAAEADRFAGPEHFLFRRAAAFQAWYEYMPVRRRSLPRGPDALLNRHLPFGRLVDVAVLDTRQYRSGALQYPHCRVPCIMSTADGSGDARPARCRRRPWPVPSPDRCRLKSSTTTACDPPKRGCSWLAYPPMSTRPVGKGGHLSPT